MAIRVAISSFIRFPLQVLREWRMKRLTREAIALMELGADRAPEFDAALAHWLLRSPHHVAAWLNVTAFYEETARSLHYPELGTIAVAINGCGTSTARKNVSAETFTAPEARADAVPAAHRREATPARRFFPAPAVAAAIGTVLLVTAGAAFWIEREVSAPTEYSTRIGEHRLFQLPDGTSVHLNTNSRIAIAFTSERRRVELLQGEALFDIAHDARPFRVRTSGAVIEDIGTRFNVRLDENLINVAVIEGQVRIGITPNANTSDDQWPRVAVDTLNAGESVSISSRAGAHEPPVVELPSDEVLAGRLAWTTGMLQFRGVALSEAVREFNRYNVRQLRIADPEIGRMRIGGQFLATGPERFAHALKNLGVRAVEPTRSAEANEPIRLVRAQP